MYIKISWGDCSCCERGIFQNEDSDTLCQLYKQGKCKGQGFGYQKLTLSRIRSTLLVAIGNRFYSVGYNLQKKYSRNSYNKTTHSF